MTFYRWKSLYGGKNSQELRRFKSFEEENRRLKQLLGEPALDIQALRTVIDPGKPNQNAYIEQFNRSLRTEVLDT